MKMLYYAQINSLISYSISMWGPMVNRCLIDQVQTLQDKAVKCTDLMLNKDAVYSTYKILTVSQMIKLEMSKLGFCLVNNLLPNQLSKALQTDHCNQSTLKTHQYNTRLGLCPISPKQLIADTGTVISSKHSQSTANCLLLLSIRQI